MSEATAIAMGHAPEDRTAEAFPVFPASPGGGPGGVGHDLTSSDSETWSLPSLLALAGPDDLKRWDNLRLGYTDPRGTAELREAIARRHATLGPENVVVCAGAQEALSCVVRALLNPGDHAVVILPIYPPSERTVTAACAATGVPLTARGGWRLDLDQVAAALRPSTKAVIANFPNSPTGATLDGAELERLVALCRRHGLWLVNDEIYRQTDVPLAECPPMVADIYERGISINGLSKGFGLPGLRIGWVACADQCLMPRAVAVKTGLSTCVTATSEILGTIALRAEGQILGLTRSIGQRNRARLSALLDALPDLFEADDLPNLAFAFPSYLGSEGSDHFTRRLAQRAGLHLLPACLWSSPLAAMPTHYVRIGLGHTKNGPALDALAAYLTGHGQSRSLARGQHPGTEAARNRGGLN